MQTGKAKYKGDDQKTIATHKTEKIKHLNEGELCFTMLRRGLFDISILEVLVCVSDRLRPLWQTKVLHYEKTSVEGNVQNRPYPIVTICNQLFF